MVAVRVGSVSAAPAGHVTLLFTDIEGSTRLARELAGDWPAVLADHHAILEREIAAREGFVEGTAGDSFLAMFTDPRAAVATAVAIQRALAAHPWPAGLDGLRVRMGLHSGVVDRLGDGFVGIDIHLAARVQGVAHGGQIVVTEPTRRLVASGFELAPLGEHRLKDFPEPERLFQVVVDGRGPGEFPPLRSATARPTNLPVELRPLLGRDAELAALREAILGRGAAAHRDGPRRDGQDAARHGRGARPARGARGRRLVRPAGRHPRAGGAAAGDRGRAPRR